VSAIDFSVETSVTSVGLRPKPAPKGMGPVQQLVAVLRDNADLTCFVHQTQGAGMVLSEGLAAPWVFTCVRSLQRHPQWKLIPEIVTPTDTYFPSL
jgi:hypothetical protein